MRCEENQQTTDQMDQEVKERILKGGSGMRQTVWLVGQIRRGLDSDGGFIGDLDKITFSEQWGQMVG